MVIETYIIGGMFSLILIVLSLLFKTVLEVKKDSNDIKVVVNGLKHDYVHLDRRQERHEKELKELEGLVRAA